MNNISIDISKNEKECLTLKGKTLYLVKERIKVSLTKNQVTLMNCLINEIHNKKEIINIIWEGKSEKDKEKSFNQLVYQLRILLVAKGFPKDTIVTIHNYGLCLNKTKFNQRANQHEEPSNLINDIGLLICNKKTNFI